MMQREVNGSATTSQPTTTTTTTKPDGYFFDIDRLLSDKDLSLERLFSEQYYFCERCQSSVRIEGGRMYDEDKQVHDCLRSIKRKTEKNNTEKKQQTPQWEMDPYYTRLKPEYQFNAVRHSPLYQINTRCNCYNCKMLRRFRNHNK
jgi:hypothetical protein